MDKRTKAFSLAKRLCIIKWTYIVNNNGSETGLLKTHPELRDFAAHCAYCELFICGNCKGCPLSLKRARFCGSTLHPWNAWHQNKTKENAQTVLDLINSSILKRNYKSNYNE